MAKAIKGRNGGTLIPPEKGEVRNPKGRGKGTLNTKTIIRKWLAVELDGKNPATGAKEKMTALDAMTVAMIGKAMKGDHNAYKAVLDRLEGRPPQKLQHTGEDGGPIKTEEVSDVNYSLLSDAALREIVKARKKSND